MGRISEKTETINQNIFTFGYNYNPTSGMLETYTYPSGFKLKYVYNQRGDMSSILGFFGTYWAGLWSGSHQNQRGQWTSYGGSSLFNTNFYDDFGYPTRTVVLNLHTKAFAQDYRYGFEPATGNLSWRTDAVRGLTESFTYDDDDDGLHSRLTGFSVNGQNMAELQYQANGNISRKTDVSAAHNSYHYQHPQGKPHAVTSVSQPTPAFVSAAPEQSIEYTAFNKVKTLINSYNFGSRQDKLDITYGPDNQRKFSRLTEDEGVGMPFITDTYYLGQYETKRELPLTEQKIHYLSGPTGLFGILVQQGSSEQLYYLLKDHLGSITGIADASGNILEDLSYDPWGRRRNAYNWTDYNVTPTRFDRGYTGHEHLGQFGLINMNGRVYDPFLARFLSPDPQLQSPDYSQNYNRYSYAWNNPLKYTDPSGEFVWLPIIIGAAIFGTTNTIIQANNGKIDDFWDGLNAFVGGAVSGAVMGATWSLGFAGIASSNTLAQIGGLTLLAGKGVNVVSTITSTIADPGNAAEIWFGRGYTDGNRDMLGQAWQGISRYTWEGLQTWLGYNYSQFRNTGDKIDRVDYLGGATFAIRENQDGRSGMSLGNFINISIGDEIEGNFDERVITDPLFMHEYGHTFDSQIFGLSYLFTIGTPSLISAAGASQIDGEPFGVTTHDFRWYEMRANRHASRYFSKYYGVDWQSPYRSGKIETYYPRKRR